MRTVLYVDRAQTPGHNGYAIVQQDGPADYTLYWTDDYRVADDALRVEHFEELGPAAQRALDVMLET